MREQTNLEKQCDKFIDVVYPDKSMMHPQQLKDIKMIYFAGASDAVKELTEIPEDQEQVDKFMNDLKMQRG